MRGVQGKVGLLPGLRDLVVCIDVRAEPERQRFSAPNLNDEELALALEHTRANRDRERILIPSYRQAQLLRPDYQHQVLSLWDRARALQQVTFQAYAMIIDALDWYQSGLADEVGDKGVGRIVVNLLRGGELRNSTLVQHRDAMAHGERLSLIVRDIDGRCTETLVEAADLDLHVLAKLLI